MMKLKLLTASLLALAATGALAQQAPASPAKKELVARILKVQQPSIEGMARALVEQPASDIMGAAGSAIGTRVAKDKQEAVAKDIQGDVQAFLDETVPVVQRRAVALAPSTAGAVLEEKFTEDELRQVINILESPAFAKFSQVSGEMQKSLGERLVNDTRGTVEPRVKALDLKIAARLGVTPAAPAPAAPAPAPRAPAKKN